MPRFPLRRAKFEDVAQTIIDENTGASFNDSDETLVLDERCRQSRSSLVEAKFSQLVSLAAARYSSYSISSSN